MGYVCIDAPQMEQYQRFLDLIGEKPWMEQPRFRDRRAMSDQYPDEAEALIAPWFMERTRQEILDACLENRIPCVPVQTFDDVLEDPQLNARDFFQSVDHPAAGEYRYPGAPYRLSKTPCRLSRPAPLLGQHNREVFCGELGLSETELAALTAAGDSHPPMLPATSHSRPATRHSREGGNPPAHPGPVEGHGIVSGPDSGLPLSRCRVVDFGTAWAGPMAAQLLADLGSQVIKVESRAPAGRPAPGASHHGRGHCRRRPGPLAGTPARFPRHQPQQAQCHPQP